MWHVTLPGIRPVIVTLLILRLGHIMDLSFEQVYMMSNAVVAKVADIFETYVYRVGMRNGQFSFGTAVGLFKSVVGLLMVILSNKFIKMLGEDGIY